jgi:hypothetical protein
MFLLVFLVHIIALALAGPLTGEFKGTSAAPDNTLSDTEDSKIHMTVSRSGGVVISNPYKNYPYWFKGNLHSHTTNSDGSNTPAQMMAAYRANGYSFNAIADHRYLTDSEQFTDLPYFLGENGEEVGSGTHMLAINIENWISSSGSVIDWVRETLRQGGMAIPAHPAYFGYTLDTLRAAVDAGAMGMEIHGDASSGPEAREWWDNLLSENRHVYGFMNDDAHSTGGIGSWGWNMVNAESLNEENIIQNIMEGNFYCVQTSPPGGIGPEIYSITVENENTIVIRSPGTYVAFIGNCGTVLATEWFVDGVASYSPSTEYTYVRMEVHDADGVSYTQPLLISVLEEFSLHLVAGWNLIGFPVTNADMTPTNLFAGTTFVMYYWTAPGGPYSEPTYTLPVEDNRGYWVRENQDTTITFSGTRQLSRTMYFVAGWNLVSFPNTSASTTPANLFAGTTFGMYYWTAPGGPYIEPTYTLPVEDNRGYWVRENQSHSVTIPL